MSLLISLSFPMVGFLWNLGRQWIYDLLRLSIMYVLGCVCDMEK